MNTAEPPIVRDAPPDHGWHALRRSDNPAALDARAALGLPTDRALIMTGHHAEWWHPGLVAKFIGAQHLARTGNHAWSWLLVDHKAGTPWTIDVPACEPEGVWRSRPIRLDAAERARPEGVPEHAHAVIAALHHPRPDLDDLEVWTDAMRDALRPQVELPPPVRATAMLRTPGARALIERMLEDPHACAHAYNDAVTRTPEAGLTHLHAGVDPGAVELPLWRIDNDATLGRVFAGDMPSTDPDRLAPRALLLSGFARLLLCDLFIHGAGGYVYDRATERWFDGWLGETLAPMGAITADMTLALDTPIVTEQEVRRARQYAHRARHHPVLLGDADAERRKLERVRTIRALPAGSEERRTEFARMHRELDEIRLRYAVELQAFEGESHRLERLRDAVHLAHRRTWPFVLFDDDARRALADEIARSLG